jgi:putative salt-induced outer membrane protein YdiY
VIIMKNGDHITCELKEIKRGLMTCDTDDIGTLNIEQDKVASLTATATFEVEDVAGGQYFGVIEPGDTPGEMKILTSSGPVILPIVDVAQLTRLGASFWQRLDGSVDLGSTYASANSLLQLNFALNVQYERRARKVELNANSSVSKQPDVEDTKRTSVTLDYVHRRPSRWLDFAQAAGEVNQELGLDFRALLAAGLGRALIRGLKNELSVGLGPDINVEKSLTGETSTNSEAATYITYDRYAYDFPKLDISISLNGFAGLSDWGRTRFEGSASFKKELVKDYYITLRGWDSYDSDPPTQDVEHNDYGYTLALGWSW